MSSNKRRKLAQHAFLSRHLPHSLPHRVAQLALEFSPTHCTLIVLPGHFPLGFTEPWHGARVVSTLAAHHRPRTARGAGQRFALPPVPTSIPPLLSPSLSPFVTAHERRPKTKERSNQRLAGHDFRVRSHEMVVALASKVIECRYKVSCASKTSNFNW